MIIKQLGGILYCFLIYLSVILIASITSCNTPPSSYSMTVKLYSECLYNTKIAPQLNATPTINQPKRWNRSGEEEVKQLCIIRARVKRWHEVNNPNTIRQFLDNGWPMYAHQLDQELWRQQAFHDLPGVVDLLYGKYAHHYFTKTVKGKSARASLVLQPKGRTTPKKEVYRDGTIEIGINETHEPHI